MNEKQHFALECKKLAGKIGDATDDLEMLSHLYSSREYGSGGADEITQEDLGDVDITIANLSLFTTLINNLTKFMDAANPTNNDYRKTIDKVRYLYSN